MLATLRRWLRLPSPPPGLDRRPRWVLYPFELYCLVSVGAIVAFIVGSGLRLGVVSVVYTIGPMLRMAPAFLGLGIGLQILYHLATRRRVSVYLGQVLSGAWLLLWARIFTVTVLWNYAYFWLKVYVPLLNPRLLDPQLWALDAALHLGFSPSVFLAEALAGSPALPLLDGWYGVWIPTIQAAVCFFAADPRPAVRRSFALACTVLWTAGAVVYCSLPALGPVYLATEVWEPLRDSMPSASSTQVGLISNYRKLLAIRETGVWTSFNPTRGIAAMPSLHVGGHVLLVLWAWRVARPLRALCMVAVVLTFLGSVVTGWHYAVDGYVGATLAVLATCVAWRLEPLPPRSPETAAPGPAAAVDAADIAKPADPAGV